MKSNPSVERNGHHLKDVLKISVLSVIILALLSAMASGCRESCDKQIIQTYEPIYKSVSEVRQTPKYTAARTIENPGKIYYKDQYIFINEVDEGIHVIDNRNMLNPVNIGFVEIPGTKDLAARGDFMYVDNYMDLIVLNIADKSNIYQANRVENVFDSYYYIDPANNSIIVDYKVEDVEVEVDDCGEFGWGWAGGGDVVALEASTAGDSRSTGIGGSLARFTISADYLYTINDYSMKLFDISTLENPIEGNTVDLGWGIETIFPYEDKLFIGAQNGMHILDNSSPELPKFISSYQHATACDPVVVQGDYAYVTLRSGRECDTFTNQLDVIDISDIHNPVLVKSYPMENPHGLGINGTCLFVTEGEFGLKVFNATDVNNIDQNMIAYHRDVHALDVIPLNNTLFMIGNDGLYQYTYNCVDQFDYLSTIPF